MTTIMVQMMQIVQEGGRILYLKAKNTVELMEWYNTCHKFSVIPYLLYQAYYLAKSNSVYRQTKDKQLP